MWAGPVVLRVGLVAEWPGSTAGGTGPGCSPCMGLGCVDGLGPWLSRSLASTEASAKAASTLASLIWLRVRLQRACPLARAGPTAPSLSVGPEVRVSGLRKATWMGRGSGCCTRGLGAEEWRAVPESCGLDESSEDSDDRDHAVPFSSSSCRLSIL